MPFAAISWFDIRYSLFNVSFSIKLAAFQARGSAHIETLNFYPNFYSISENLVLWARSEIIGSALLNKELLNSKHAWLYKIGRKPKQYRMTKIKMIQTKDIAGIAM